MRDTGPDCNYLYSIGYLLSDSVVKVHETCVFLGNAGEHKLHSATRQPAMLTPLLLQIQQYLHRINTCTLVCCLQISTVTCFAVLQARCSVKVFSALCLSNDRSGPYLMDIFLSFLHSLKTSVQMLRTGRCQCLLYALLEALLLL